MLNDGANQAQTARRRLDNTVNKWDSRDEGAISTAAWHKTALQLLLLQRPVARWRDWSGRDVLSDQATRAGRGNAHQGARHLLVHQPEAVVSPESAVAEQQVQEALGQASETMAQRVLRGGFRGSAATSCRAKRQAASTMASRLG
jgi:hypothetical protein